MANGNGKRIVKDLAEVREIITNTVTDDTKRRKLLRLAGAAPDVWLGCSVGDVVFMLEDELADQERGVQVVETASAAAPAQPTVIHVHQPAQQPAQPVQYAQQPAQPVQYVQAPAPTMQPRTGMGVGRAVLTGMVAGRVAGNTVARRRF